MSNPDEFEAQRKFHTFVPAPAGSSPEERSAAALEFIAKQMGDIAWSIEHFSQEQMSSLIANLPG